MSVFKSFFLYKCLKNSFVLLSCIFFVFSILNPYHTLPWVSFYSEKYSFLSFICIAFFLLNEKLKIPYIIIPVFFISLVPIIQYYLGLIIFFETAFLGMVYLFCFFISIIFGYNLSKASNSDNVFDAISLFSYILIFISLISSLIIIFQWLNFYNLQPYVLKIMSTRPYGNLAQPNQMGTILLMGIASSWYVYEKKNEKSIALLFTTLIILFSVVLTQSRTSWLIILLLFLYYLYKKKICYLKITTKKIIFLILFFVSNVILLPLYNYLFTFINLGVVQTVDVLTRSTTGYLRLGVWMHFFKTLMEKPLQGYGWYQTQLANISLIEESVEPQVIDSSHNIVLDLLIWCGIPLGVMIFGLFFLFLVRILIKSSSLENLFFSMIIIIICTHAFLEYPLFYSYFLFPLGFVIGGALVQFELNYTRSTKKINVFSLLFLITLFFVIDVGYEYMYRKRMNLALIDEYKNETLPDYFPPESSFIIENFFYDRSDFIIFWIKFNPYQLLGDAQIEKLKINVRATATQQGLIKLAVLLAYNNKKEEALNIIDIIDKFYHVEIKYEQLHEKIIFDKICRFCT
ncbi:pilin glycosylation ligase domain-containing protein [Acinetobacter bereziniae]|uniref:O-antigen ligase family protein n=1 Tax=Acinetobacter bereziniae TaxID=106648 RepID=UPI0021D19961|nr:O-antigen ligase family protein [Acinetobacter bereziniae]MCU4436196.1 pilin glycosylation ligase domain-containing protein [Acinetobacter bereziniae]